MRGPDMRTMSAGGPMGGRMGPGGQQPQMPWQRGPQQGQPDWGSIVQRFRDRFQQHNPFAGMQGQGGGMPQGGPQQPMPQPAPGAAPGGAPMQGPPQGANPWAARIAEAAQRFGGNRQPPGRGQY